MTRQAVIAAVSALLAVGYAHALGTGPVSDLTITNTDAAPRYTAGFGVIYTIVVANAGPDDAAGVAVSDPVTSLAQVTGASWTCVAAGGATCTAGPVTGALVDTVTLPVGGTATYTLVTTINAAATGDLVNTATVTPAAGTTDPGPGANTAIDTDTAATIFSVATTGTDSDLCGNSAIACKTIQQAITNAAPGGDTVLVASGTYNECPVVADGFVRIESSEFKNAATNVATIIDATGVCDTAILPAAVVTLTDGSSLRGFTIKGGSTGVAGTGSVSILNNVITGNASAVEGGGLRLASGSTIIDPDAKTVIKGNTITGNTSAGSGAGIYIETLNSPDRNVVEIDGNTITGNTAGDGTAGVLGAGITVLSDTASAADSSRVVIVSNTVDGNVAKNTVGDATLAFGGGIFVTTGATLGLGTETVIVGATGTGNRVRNNVSEGFGGGMSINVRPAPAAKHTADVAANTVSANTGNYGAGGMHLFLRAVDRTAGPAPDAILRTTANSITGNHARAPQGDENAVPDLITSGGGLSAELQSDRTVAAAVLFEISGNTLEHNDRATRGGGASLLASADDDPNDDGATAPTDANISFHHNLVALNAAHDDSAGGASGGGVHALAVARGGSASAGVSQDFLTVASNTTEVGSGGIEWDDAHPANSIGSTGTTSFTLSNSIVFGNEGFGVGGSVLPSASTTVAVSYTDAFGNSSGNFEAQLGVTPGSNGVISVDPELDALFLPRLCGPTIDAGDPSINPELEPVPNGGRVNLGHLGNTASAARTFPDVNVDGTIDGLDVLGIAVSFAASSPDPRYFTAADRDLNLIVDGEDLAIVTAFYGQSCP